MQVSDLAAVGAQALLPPEDITVSEWAEKHRRLTGSASSERGTWHTRPYQKEPMDVLSPSDPCREVVLMTCAQMMKTEVLLNFLGFIADVDPGPTLVVEPRTEDAKALSKDRLAPMFAATERLRGKLADVKSRDSDNTVLHKAFPNDSGHVTLTGAISPSGLAMRPIRYALLDEVDRYPLSAGTEGDPVTLAKRRTDEFAHNKKILLASTPTKIGSSRIHQAFLESDQREWYVPCPLCGEYQMLLMGDGTGAGLVWQEDKPETAHYRCAHCQGLIPHGKKAWMEERGKWVAHNPESKIPGFHINQLHGKRSWGEIATEFVAAKKSPETLCAFVNTVLGELWEERSEVPPDAQGLFQRCETYGSECPAGVAIITAGVDVQADRLELEIVGWGVDEESWSLAYHAIPGDPSRTEVWNQLDELLLQVWKHPLTELPVHAAAVDSGFKDAMVLRFCRDKFRRRVLATKGRTGDGPIWPRKPSRKLGTPFYMINVDAAKDSIYDRLKIEDPGAGFCHFPYGRDREYFDGLTSERKATRYRNGFPKREWRKGAGVRNEPLDCRVYAYAALHMLYLSGVRLNLVAERMTAALSERQASLFDQVERAPSRAASVPIEQHMPAMPPKLNPFTGRSGSWIHR
jgi:phage terminase large subunit GpA-like protein